MIGRCSEGDGGTGGDATEQAQPSMSRGDEREVELAHTLRRLRVMQHVCCCHCLDTGSADSALAAVTHRPGPSRSQRLPSRSMNTATRPYGSSVGNETNVTPASIIRL